MQSFQGSNGQHEAGVSYGTHCYCVAVLVRAYWVAVRWVGRVHAAQHLLLAVHVVWSRPVYGRQPHA